ncbi:MAG: hypothetical protein R3F49_11845 [Planctomycetota bacterium]
MKITLIRVAALALSSAISTAQTQVYLDADTPATGSLLQTQPLLTALGTIRFVGEVRATSDPELAAAGSVGNVFDINAPNSDAELFFDFDVAAITFIYGGNTGGILLEARDAAGAVVDSFYQADTNAGQPAGPETLMGAGIRSLYWVDPGFSFAAIDNVTIDTQGGALGVNYCGPAPVNSTGASGGISATGSAVVAANDVTLIASALPTNSFGFFLASESPGFVAHPGGSQGNLCLGSPIGRYVGAGQIQNSGAAGTFSLVLDLTQTPLPSGIVAIAGGEVWRFQAWYRDASGGAATSNFTDGLEIGFM